MKLVRASDIFDLGVTMAELKHTAEKLVGVANEEKEVCICAAVQTPNGSIFRGHRHSHAMAVAWSEYAALRITQDMQGFVTSRNRFVTRAEGAELQRLAGVNSAATGREVEGDALFSEDLY